MSTKKKLLLGSAGAAAAGGGATLDVDEVFSTFLYEGNNTFGPHTITNGIDLSGEDGLVWIKSRDSASSHGLYDTERGATKYLQSNATSAEATLSLGLTSFNSNGFSVDYSHYADSHVSWTFRKAPKFFQCLTYTGNTVGSSAQTISHGLGSTPGFIIVKRYSTADNWAVWHRYNANGTGFLNVTDAFYTTISSSFISSVGSTSFTVGESLNTNGASFVAYVFAHNDGDGEFGPDGDQDIIKCGSYTGNGSSDSSSQDINLGFESQWVLIKNTTISAGWYMIDNMRGMSLSTSDGYLYANSNSAEGEELNNLGVESHSATSTGFRVGGAGSQNNQSGHTYIYMAIRRGPLAAPDDATKVFAISTGAGTDAPMWTSNFPIDMAMNRDVSGAVDTSILSRLTGTNRLETNTNDAEVSSNSSKMDYMDGYHEGTSNLPTYYSWMWKRAPSYFDVCCYTGNQTSGLTVSHNLGAVPEMMWVKNRSAGTPWMVYHSALGNQAYLQLSVNNAEVTGNTSRWNATTPTASVFSLGDSGSVNALGSNLIAYLFATVAGV